jgi:glutaredoxin
VKELLSQAGIPFVARDVEIDLDAYHDLIARGFRTVPVTVIGDGAAAVAVKGFDEVALRSALSM